MRLMIVAFAGLLLPVVLVAQTFSFSLKAGPNTSHQVGWCCGEVNPFDARGGVTAGVAATMRITGPLALQSEILYSGKGVKGGKTFQMRLNYLELPLLVRLQHVTRFPIQPVLLVGFAPAFELSCTGITRPPSIPERPAPLEPLDCSGYRTSTTDLGLVGAVGADVRVAGVFLTVELRHTHGIRDLTSEWPFATRTTNRATTVLFGARFR